ncbi:MAG: MFS transporter [Candidatus Thiodubiliella endoseptemdiera]|uniref:MFS transporter n=1 Tax=Candidatus Thiodubiliella endoseptemdiera TaxID=2738886 RepID=A0A853F6Z5_9GAMM|nr:MFS transporter [Candidatus Thiodubiliella endoseptemdiera]
MNKNEHLFALKISSIMATRMFGLFMIFPVFSVYATQYENTTPYLIGLAIGIYGLTQAVLQIPFGYLSDQYGRKPLLVAGLVFFFIGSVVAANSTDIIHVVIGRALQGSGAISAVLMAFLADFVSKEQRSKANAFVGMQIGLAFMLSLLIGPMITVNLGLSGLFWVIAGLSIIAMVIVATLPHAKPCTQYVLSMANLKQVLTAKLLKLDFSVFTLHLILTCIFIVMPLLLVENKIVLSDLSDNWRVYLPVMLLSFVGMLPIIIVAEKFKKHKFMMISAILIMLLSQLLFYKISLSYTAFLVLMTLFFIAFNAMEAMLPSMISRIATDDKRGLAMGMYSTSQFLGAFVGGVVGGAIYHIKDLNSVFLFTLLMTIIWLGVVLSIKSQKL